MEEHPVSPCVTLDGDLPASDYATLDAAAAYIGGGLTKRTVQRWIAEGRLPVYRFSPKVVRVRLSEVDALARPQDGTS
jgi:excisionase family DNA binding protein